MSRNKSAAPSEKWLPIPGYEGRYAANLSLGLVRSLDRTVTDTSGRVVHRKGRILRPQAGNADGHKHVCLYRDGVKVFEYVHHLILLTAGVGPRPAEMEARHLNGDPADNRIVNLTWGTKAENVADRMRHAKQSRELAII